LTCFTYLASWLPTRRRIFANAAINCSTKEIGVASGAAVFLQESAEQSAKTCVLSILVGDPNELIETTLGQLLAEANVRPFNRSIK
jgi:hypothetical protein